MVTFDDVDHHEHKTQLFLKWIEYHVVLITSSMPNVSSPFTIRKLNKIWLTESLNGVSDHTLVISDHTQDRSLFRVHLCMVRYFMYGLFLTWNDSLAMNLTIWSRGTIRHNSGRNIWIRDQNPSTARLPLRTKLCSM